MPPLSLKKIFIAILSVIALINLNKIHDAFAPVAEWFRDSLFGLYDFPRGAQTAIAFLSLVFLIVAIVKYKSN
jgi:hypothetical protein